MTKNKLSEKALIVLKLLRENVEENFKGVDGKQWGIVNSVNVRGAAEEEGITSRSFSGYLSKLTNESLYSASEDGYIGYVKLEKQND